MVEVVLVAHALDVARAGEPGLVVVLDLRLDAVGGDDDRSVGAGEEAVYLVALRGTLGLTQEVRVLIVGRIE